MKKNLRFLAFTMLFAFALNMGLNAATARNAGTYNELTVAITASVDGDIINITDNIVVTAQITINKSLTINGNDYTITVPVPGLDEMGRFNGTPSAFRVFELNTAGKTVIINNLTMQGGLVAGFGGSIYISSATASLTLNNCIITRSRATGGGGICNKGVLFVFASYVRRNGADYGGGILNDGGRAYFESSTMVENRVTSTDGGGGAVENKNSGYMYFNNATLSNNQAQVVGGAVNNYTGTLYFVNSSATGNVVYGRDNASLCIGGAISNNGGTIYAVNSLFAHNYRATTGTTANPATYILDDVAAYSGQGSVNLYYSIYHATLPSGMGTTVSNIQYAGLANGSDNTIFSGGISAKITDNNGNEIGEAVYRPFLYNNQGSVAPTLMSGSFVLQLANRGTRTRFANNSNVSPVVAYHNGTSWVNLTGTGAAGQEVNVDQVGAARPDPPACGAIEGTVGTLYMVKVLVAANGTVNGGTFYGDVYPSGTSVTVTGIPNTGYSFTRWDYVLGGTGTASSANPYTFAVSANLTLQPVFTSIPAGNYTITYVGNGNTGGTAPASGTFSASTTLSNQGTLVSDRSVFSGWNTNENGSGTAYAAGDTYAAGVNLTLYAQWSQFPTVASLTATGANIKWYAAAANGTPLASTTLLVNGTHYYASQTVNGCESATRMDVTATVTAVPATPTAGTHTAAETQIIWNWNTVSGATGYRWSTTNNYATSTDMGALTTKTETSLSCGTSFTRYVWAYNTCSSAPLTLSKATLMCCGASFTINHVAGTVAPIDKAVTYGTVTNIPGETAKCWTTKNLGATRQATAKDDATEESAGWYWQFNLKQGYKHDGTNRTPNTTWLSNSTFVYENSDWVAANDPCTIELGVGWRLPTGTEWNNVDVGGAWANYTDAFNSGLKLHAGGGLAYTDGSLNWNGSTGSFWSSTQTLYSTTNGVSMYINSTSSYYGNNLKAWAFPLRCIR